MERLSEGSSCKAFPWHHHMRRSEHSSSDPPLLNDIRIRKPVIKPHELCLNAQKDTQIPLKILLHHTQNPKTFRQRPVQARNFHVLNSLSLRCLGIPKLLYLVVIQEDSLSPPGLLLIPFLKSIL